MSTMLFIVINAPTTKLYPLSLHDALPISFDLRARPRQDLLKELILLLAGQNFETLDEWQTGVDHDRELTRENRQRSEDHTSELQSRLHLVCRLLLEKKKSYNFRALQSYNR